MYKLDGLKEKPKLLTIAIPTYNRASYLDLCLSQICSQVRGYEDLIDMVISDNCSTDNTQEIVEKYINRGFKITYLQSDKNNGTELNFLKCFNVANSKYFWLFSDDDVLLDGGLQKIIEVLESGEYGIVYMNPYTYSKDFLAEKPRNESSGYDVYYSKKDFLRVENYFFMYITGNIVNKSLVNLDLDINSFIGGFLSYVIWVLSAFSNSAQNVHIRDVILGYKLGNSGGFAACRVFGPSFEKIFRYFHGRGIDYDDFKTIKRRLVFELFPDIVRKSRKGKMESYEKENYCETLYPVFKNYVGFWLFTYPMIKLPVKLTFIPFIIIRVCSRFLRLFDFLRLRFDILVGNVKRCKYKSG